ncbi:pupal cuticle protein 36-like [Penaeus chinensis]|uniref:pupal cuticle protein 36-like n=1 Tax=Penaeus chinensis TaxID=139456 RepID=UPI001FB5CAD2|nr:pupal cuticle protein 36-like [Penaeus chinensis]
MRVLVLACAIVATTTAAPQGYSLQSPTGSTLSTGPGQTAGSGFTVGSATGHVVAGGVGIGSGHGVTAGAAQGGVSGGFGQGVGTGISGVGVGILEPCGEGQIRHVDGSCHTPVVNRKVFVFDVPEQKRPLGPPPSVPPPRVDHNILFVRLPEEGEGPEPIVIPPPRQENIVYVLNKKDEQVQRVIEVPAHPPSDPEIYFVNYEEGENPTLPIGVDLNTALGSAAEAGGRVIGVAGGDNSEGTGFGVGGVVGGSGFGTVSGGFGGASVGSGFGTGSGGLGGAGAGSGFGTVSGGLGGAGAGSGFGAVSGGVGSSPSGLYNTP